MTGSRATPPASPDASSASVEATSYSSTTGFPRRTAMLTALETLLARLDHDGIPTVTLDPRGAA